MNKIFEIIMRLFRKEKESGKSVSIPQWMTLYDTNSTPFITSVINTFKKNVVKDIFPDSYMNYDYEAIEKLMVSTFGVEDFALFSLHANGSPYEDLYKISDSTNLKYKFRQMRAKVKNI